MATRLEHTGNGMSKGMSRRGWPPSQLSLERTGMGKPAPLPAKKNKQEGMATNPERAGMGMGMGMGMGIGILDAKPPSP